MQNLLDEQSSERVPEPQNGTCAHACLVCSCGKALDKVVEIVGCSRGGRRRRRCRWSYTWNCGRWRRIDGRPCHAHSKPVPHTEDSRLAGTLAGGSGGLFVLSQCVAQSGHEEPRWPAHLLGLRANGVPGLHRIAVESVDEDAVECPVASKRCTVVGLYEGVLEVVAVRQEETRLHAHLQCCGG